MCEIAQILTGHMPKLSLPPVMKRFTTIWPCGVGVSDSPHMCAPQHTRLCECASASRTLLEPGFEKLTMFPAGPATFLQAGRGAANRGVKCDGVPAPVTPRVAVKALRRGRSLHASDSCCSAVPHKRRLYFSQGQVRTRNTRTRHGKALDSRTPRCLAPDISRGSTQSVARSQCHQAPSSYQRGCGAPPCLYQHSGGVGTGSPPAA
jgi:hypothetical protein